MYTICNFLLHSQQQVYYLQVTQDGMLRITVSLLIVDALRLKVQFTKNDKRVWLNLDFTFLKCTFSLILHTSGPTRTFTKMLDFSWIHLCFVPSSVIMCSVGLKLECCCYFKYFQFEISGRGGGVLPAITTRLLNCLHVIHLHNIMYVGLPWLSYRHQTGGEAQNSVSCLTRLLHCPQHMTWKNVR